MEPLLPAREQQRKSLRHLGYMDSITAFSETGKVFSDGRPRVKKGAKIRSLLLVYNIDRNLDAGTLSIGADHGPNLLCNTTLTANDLAHDGLLFRLHRAF